MQKFAVQKIYIDGIWIMGGHGAGYNFLVRKDGSIYELRDIKYVPAHATNYNTCSIGICFEGNFEEEKMGQAQIEAGIWLVAYLKSKYNITLVQKHKDVNATSCPGKNFPFDEIANNVGIGTAVSTEIKHDTNIGEAVSTILKENTVYDIQKFLNGTYGTNLVLDNIYGAETKKALIKALQTELNKQFNKSLVVDGIFGNNTYNACINVKKGAKGNITKLIQMTLYIKGYKVDIDSIFGSDTETKVKAFQKANGLTVDGVAGKNTFKALFA